MVAPQGRADPAPLAAARRPARRVPRPRRAADRVRDLRRAGQAEGRLLQRRSGGRGDVRRRGRGAQHLGVRRPALRRGRADPGRQPRGGDREGRERRGARRADRPARRRRQAARDAQPRRQPRAPGGRGRLQRRGPGEEALRRVDDRVAAGRGQPGAERRDHEDRGLVPGHPAQGRGHRPLHPRVRRARASSAPRRSCASRRPSCRRARRTARSSSASPSSPAWRSTTSTCPTRSSTPSASRCWSRRPT